jgi:hypothetical protein
LQQARENNTRLIFWLLPLRNLPVGTQKDARISRCLFLSRCSGRNSPQSMPSTHKKVIVRKIDRDSISGYVAPANFVHEGKLELLNTAGNVIGIDLREIKGVYFVREFGDSESLTRKTFTSRPRTEGLWVRLKFKDNEIIEGLMPNDLAQQTSDGFLVNPPDLRSNTQRIFVPRTALDSLTVLAVIGGTHRQRRRPEDQLQVPMFGE